jgi:alcohol dehydrogenase (cytochrome c)
MLWANRNGFYYVLDRTTGKFLTGKPFSTVNWAKGLDESGRPMKVKGMEPTVEGQQVYPGVQGATNWYSPSYSPRTGLFYIPAWDKYSSVFVKVPTDYTEGRRYVGTSPRSVVGLQGAAVNQRKEDEGYGAVRAIDPKTGEQKWEFKMLDVTDAGVLTTASDVLFSGGREGYFYALDGRSGELLWKANVGGGVSSGPISYAVNGRQYISVTAGSSLLVYALKQ